MREEEVEGEYSSTALDEKYTPNFVVKGEENI